MAEINQETNQLLNTLLILLVAGLQFLLHRGPQSGRVRALEARLAEVEAQLTDLQDRFSP